MFSTVRHSYEFYLPLWAAASTWGLEPSLHKNHLRNFYNIHFCFFLIRRIWCRMSKSVRNCFVVIFSVNGIDTANKISNCAFKIVISILFAKSLWFIKCPSLYYDFCPCWIIYLSFKGEIYIFVTGITHTRKLTIRKRRLRVPSSL